MKEAARFVRRFMPAPAPDENTDSITQWERRRNNNPYPTPNGVWPQIVAARKPRQRKRLSSRPSPDAVGTSGGISPCVVVSHKERRTTTDSRRDASASLGMTAATTATKNGRGRPVAAAFRLTGAGRRRKVVFGPLGRRACASGLRPPRQARVVKRRRMRSKG